MVIPILDGSGRYLVQVDDEDAEDDDPHVFLIPYEDARPARMTRRPKRARRG
jgi:hypothetical protein